MQIILKIVFVYHLSGHPKQLMFADPSINLYIHATTNIRRCISIQVVRLTAMQHDCIFFVCILHDSKQHDAVTALPLDYSYKQYFLVKNLLNYNIFLAFKYIYVRDHILNIKFRVNMCELCTQHPLRRVIMVILYHLSALCENPHDTQTQ